VAACLYGTDNCDDADDYTTPLLLQLLNVANAYIEGRDDYYDQYDNTTRASSTAVRAVNQNAARDQYNNECSSEIFPHKNDGNNCYISADAASHHCSSNCYTK